MFSSRTKWSHRDTFQGYAPSWMRVSTVLNRGHITCVLWQRFFCVWWHIFIPFYSISLCFLNPGKCLEHAISLTTQHRKHLPLFWTWHTLALFAASEIWWETCSPFPFVLIISTAQSSHSKDGKSSFLQSFTCAELLSHLFFFTTLHCTYCSSIYSLSRWRGTEPYNYRFLQLCLLCFLFST